MRDTRIRCSKCGFYLEPELDDHAIVEYNDGRKYVFHYDCFNACVGNVRSVSIIIMENEDVRK